jgi:hypothetical protein
VGNVLSLTWFVVDEKVKRQTLLMETAFAHRIFNKTVGIADKDWRYIPNWFLAIPTLRKF